MDCEDIGHSSTFFEGLLVMKRCDTELNLPELTMHE
jgi:hypothetical protein